MLKASSRPEKETTTQEAKDASSPNVVPIDSDLDFAGDDDVGYDSDSEAHHQLEAREQQCVVGADAEEAIERKI